MVSEHGANAALSLLAGATDAQLMWVIGAFATWETLARERPPTPMVIASAGDGEAAYTPGYAPNPTGRR